SVRREGYDVATGSRRMPGNEQERDPERGVASTGFNALVRLFLRSPMYDHQCGFKAFDREVLFDLLTDVEDDHWFWDTEVLVRAQRAGYDVREFPVKWEPKGDTTVDLVRDVFGMGSQILRLWWQVTVSPRIDRRVTTAAGTLLVVVAVALMTVYLDPSAVLDAVGSADPALVGLATLVYLLSWPLRGLRYRDILAKLGYRERVGFLTGAVFVSQTGNLVFPARAGDAVRAYIVKARRDIPYPSGFASLAIERVFDLLTIAALAGGTFIALAVAGATLGRVSDDSYVEYVAGVVERFAGDVQTVADDRRAFAAVGASSLAIWALDVMTALVVFLAFGVELAVWELVAVGFFAVSVGNLAKVLPLSPGGIGLYEGAFTLIVVALTSVPAAVALTAAVVDHAVKNVVTVVGGVASTLLFNVSLTEAVEESRDIEGEAAARD
ncbi:glycosyl transferase, partial [Halobacteriales archaeon QS_7_69_60]